ncbi:zinc finger, PHD-type containing protein, partial [Tanacetum coccineum]
MITYRLIVALVMVIDKSWTSLGKHEKAFYTGLKKFIDDCKPLVDSVGNIRYPYLLPPPPVIDNTRKPQMSDMTVCLNDLNYIPLNNEQNEPTQGDIRETSVETIDVAIGLQFNIRAMVIWTINDFPARSSLSGWSGQGYKACPTCSEDTPSVRVLGKTAYVGHRRFLKKPHKWRRSLEFNGETENRDPPREFSRDAIMTQLARLPTRVKGKHPRFGGVKIKRNVLVELNWTKRSIFYELEYWSFYTLKHNLDVMHIEKNVLESILNTLLMNDKSKDTTKARQDLKSLGIRSGLWLGPNKNGKCSKLGVFIRSVYSLI